MNDSQNILILSCGTRNKLIQYFKQEFAGVGKIMATDCSELAPALYEADKHFIVSKMTDEGYLDEILKICKDNQIKGVLSLIDPELTLLAENRQAFLDIGTVPFVSDYELILKCFNKFSFNNLLKKHGFKSIRSYVDKELFYKDVEEGHINYPVFVKPVQGSASININQAENKDEIEVLFHKFDNLMIQELMDGTEFGIDAYIDFISGEIISIFVKEKIKMRAGETDKSKAVKDTKLIEMLESFINKVGFKGPIDIDVFQVDGEYYISEVNPRFGGGYLHAFEVGENFPKMILENLLNKSNEPRIGQYQENTFMMKYNDIKILKA